MIQDSPVYVAIDASRPSFITYTGGIYNDDECSNSTVNHAVKSFKFNQLEITCSFSYNLLVMVFIRVFPIGY